MGLDLPNDLSRRVWDFLRPHVLGADAFVFSRRAFIWEGIPEERTWIVPPSIDAFSPKNQDLADDAVHAILAQIGLGDKRTSAASFTRTDGTPGRVDRAAEIDQDGLVPEGAALITQVSRWDLLKDPRGVLEGFAEHLASSDAHLLLAGPEVAAVADDPEALQVLEHVRTSRSSLPAGVKARVHLACLPMDDIEENAAIVNAIQRRSDVIVRKALPRASG